MSERTVIVDGDLAGPTKVERQRSIPWCETHDKQAVWGEHKMRYDRTLDFDDFTFTSCEFGHPDDCDIVEGRVWEVIDE